MTRILLLILFLAIIKNSVFACDCDGTPSFETEFKGSDKIFVGEVVSIKPSNRLKKWQSEFVVEFKIDTIYKGSTEERIKVRTAVAVASCGYPFEKGKAYLVYSFANHNAFYVTYCSRTKELNEAKEDIDKLSSLRTTGGKMATHKVFAIVGLAGRSIGNNNRLRYGRNETRISCHREYRFV